MDLPTGDYRLMCYADSAHMIGGNWLPFRIITAARLDLTREAIGQGMRIDLKGEASATYILEVAKEVNGPWDPIYTNKAPFSFFLPPDAKNARQFFRAMEFDNAQ